jgi:hypothetical protein
VAAGAAVAAGITSICGCGGRGVADRAPPQAARDRAARAAAIIVSVRIGFLRG